MGTKNTTEPNSTNLNPQLSFNNTQIAFKYLSNPNLKQAILLFKVINNNTLVKIGLILTQFALIIGLPIKGLIKQTIFKHFCGGETIDECTITINLLAKYGVGTILDYSVEGSNNEKSFEHTQQEILSTILKAAAMPQQIAFAVFKVSGLVSFALLEKISAKKQLSQIEDLEYQKAVQRIQFICKTAFDLDIKVMIDAEESWIQPAIDSLALSMMQQFNTQKAIVFNTYQLYLNYKFKQLKADIEFAQTKKINLGAKLVRGAYMEKEAKRAEELSYASPINTSKQKTDDDYNEALKLCIDRIVTVSIVAGTHNEYSCGLLTNLMLAANLKVNYPNIYFSQLLGMSDNLSFNLAKAGYNVAKYVPYGPIKLVMPYLFRRAQENTAIAGQASRELQLYKTEWARRKNLN